MPLRQLCRLLLCLILAISMNTTVMAQGKIATQAIPKIHVGGYQFAPYVNQQADGRYTGLTLDIINALNQIQQEVTFVFVATSIEHRYQAYSLGRFDMMMFESPTWGWQDIATHFIPLHIHDGEAFIALKTHAHNQGYFDDMTNKSIVFVKGYHYQFAQFETKAEILSKQFKPLFVNNNKASIESIIRKRADVAPVTYSYLQHYLKVNPKDKNLLLISDKWDQEYAHGILLKPHLQLDEKKLSEWVQQLSRSGQLGKLAAQYGISLTQ